MHMVGSAPQSSHLLVEGVLIRREIAQQRAAVCEHHILLLLPSLGARNMKAGHLRAYMPCAMQQCKGSEYVPTGSS